MGHHGIGEIHEPLTDKWDLERLNWNAIGGRHRKMPFATEPSELMASMKQFRALAATARIANLPSVVSNVWLGIALGGWTSGGWSWWKVGSLGISGVFLCLSGNFLNDWKDQAWDAKHRPERALPRKLFPPVMYLTTGVLCGLLGLCNAASAGPRCIAVALGILICILIYTWIHKRTAWSVIPMGLCRALLPVLGFAGFARAGSIMENARLAVCLAAVGLFCHIVGLSVSARRESANGGKRGNAGFTILLFAVTLIAMAWIPMGLLKMRPVPGLLGILPYLIWLALAFTAFRKTVKDHVSSLLAGIPLVDWIVLMPLSGLLEPPFSTACLWIPPLAFVTGRLLQRLAPAT